MNHQTLTRICKGLNVTWDTVIKEPGVLEVKVTDLAFFMDISIEEATRMLQGKEHEPTFADLAEVLKNENINPADWLNKQIDRNYGNKEESKCLWICIN